MPERGSGPAPENGRGHMKKQSAAGAPPDTSVPWPIHPGGGTVKQH